MQPIIRLDRVTKRFGHETALDDVSLEVPPGVVFALLGENGAGKTTAIRLMLGLTEPSAGSVEVLGLDSQTHGLEIRRQVGYVPERPTFYDWMTVSEVGWFTAGFYGDGYETRYRELATEFQLPLGRKIKALSKGMRAKVGLSLAMAHQPKLLVLDEPTSGLDTLVRREFLESMVELTAAGQSVLLSSHQISEVERVADIVAIIRGGRLLLVEPLDELKAAVRQLTVTLSDGAVAPPRLAGELLCERHHGRQWQMIVRSPSNDQDQRPDNEFELLRDDPSVRDLEIHTPSLEEIFVAYLKSASEPAEGVDYEHAEPSAVIEDASQ